MAKDVKGSTLEPEVSAISGASSDNGLDHELPPAGDDKNVQAAVAETIGENVLNSDPSDEGVSVKGHAVIRNGMDVSKYLVSARDDGDTALTFRSIVLGTSFTAFSSVVTMLYVFKPVQVSVSAVFLQLLVFIFGEAWALCTPRPDRFKSPWI
ncbi:Putative oligopeptide transporter, OPT superfamily [Septoria linicola]|uniref:Oligopeptide transporter, OPT superfamily n=1 Tax=Septoria linicola TaxID=215465 RepID=A0A9Q9EPW5_9PEZI|nr:putative oligopeptide transporter, OPT superfamily [Septoria linicola]USW59191.1 Putative oligopeptide transporter, OPT superfamily [Septoria linicola]